MASTINAAADPIDYRVIDNIAVIRVQNPPVNALSQAVRQGLSDAVARFQSDDTAQVALIIGDGRTFIAGADIKEFGRPAQEPFLPALINRIEACGKPIVAALHGTGLGGGLEIAMGAHYRVALRGAKMGLPEVTLGILPGAGGTQRLPRLVGVAAALDMITSGRHVGADEALKMGLIDAISEVDDVQSAGLIFARELASANKPVCRTGELPPPVDNKELFDGWRSKVVSKARGQISPMTCIDAVQAATGKSFQEGLARERELFDQLMASPQREGLIHAFFAERKVSKLPELAGITPRAISQIGVVGGGTMGAGIAVSALLSGLNVTLVERGVDEAQVAKDRIAKILRASVQRGKLTEPNRATILADKFAVASDYTALAPADLVIEAVFESMQVKHDVFARLDAVCRKGAVLASNTSYLDINAIAARTSRPQDVIGLHFFSPAHIMKLLEVVVADNTAPDVAATGFALAKKLRKVGVRAGVCDGFIGNRILSTYRTAADHMVLAGASPYQIDKALTGFGFAMGPFAVADLAGLDIGWANRKRLAATLDARERVAGFPDRICELGRFGRKTGRGFYIYQDGDTIGTPDPEVEDIIARERAELGISARAIDDEEIVRRYMMAMINEAAKVVDEGIARRPLDVDVTLLYGYGFPRYRGGPMKTADQYGLDIVLSDLKRYAQEDAYFWQPAKLIEQLVASGRNFDSMNEL